jgi:hypothetical protein
MKTKKKNNHESMESIINGKGAGHSPSYKNIFPVNDLGTYKSYRKPTRKAAMGRPPNGKEARQMEQNSVSMAMDVPKLDGVSLFRAPAKLPPVYQAQLKDLETAVKGIENYNSTLLSKERAMNQNHNVESKTKNFELKFRIL